MHLVGNDAHRHSVACFTKDAHAATQGLATPTNADLTIILIKERSHVIEAMPAYVIGALRVIFPTRGAADVHGASNDQFAGVEANLAYPLL